MVHTTVGIYPNGHSKVNGVLPEHLKEHIEYNRVCRPGRMLMVDGEVVLKGYGGGNQKDGEYLTRMRQIKRDTCTAPYQ